MRHIKEFTIGISSYPKAVGLIFSKNLWYFYGFSAILLIINIIGADFLYKEIAAASFISPASGHQGEEYDILIFGLKCVAYFITFRLTNYVVLVLLSPVMTRLSIRTENILTGNKYPFSFTQYAKDIDRAFRIVARNLVLQLILIAIFYAITFFMPSGNTVRWVLVFITSAYFYGFSLLDYNIERMKLNIEDSVKLVRKHFALTWALGAIYFLLFMIPFAGVVIGPVTGIVAATIGLHETIDLSKNQSARQEFEVPIQ